MAESANNRGEEHGSTAAQQHSAEEVTHDPRPLNNSLEQLLASQPLNSLGAKVGFGVISIRK